MSVRLYVEIERERVCECAFMSRDRERVCVSVRL